MTNNLRPGQPMTKQRSQWQPRPDLEHLAVFVSNVHDGSLRAMVADPDGPEGEWHLSISHVYPPSKTNKAIGRYPSWDEIADARYRLVPASVTMAMVLPPPDEFVAVHDTTFHLHQLLRADQ